MLLLCADRFSFGGDDGLDNDDSTDTDEDKKGGEASQSDREDDDLAEAIAESRAMHAAETKGDSKGADGKGADAKAEVKTDAGKPEAAKAAATAGADGKAAEAPKAAAAAGDAKAGAGDSKSAADSKDTKAAETKADAKPAAPTPAKKPAPDTKTKRRSLAERSRKEKRKAKGVKLEHRKRFCYLTENFKHEALPAVTGAVSLWCLLFPVCVCVHVCGFLCCADASGHLPVIFLRRPSFRFRSVVLPFCRAPDADAAAPGPAPPRGPPILHRNARGTEVSVYSVLFVSSHSVILACCLC